MPMNLHNHPEAKCGIPYPGEKRLPRVEPDGLPTHVGNQRKAVDFVILNAREIFAGGAPPVPEKPKPIVAGDREKG